MTDYIYIKVPWNNEDKLFQQPKNNHIQYIMATVFLAFLSMSYKN